MKSKDYNLRPIFTQCLAELFQGRELSIRDEVDDFAKGKIPNPPSARECGNHPKRLKFLLPKNQVTVMYWDYGSRLDFFGVLEEDNHIHVTLYQGMLLDRKIGKKS